MKRGSAYDLYLSRTLQHATVVQDVEGTTAFRTHNLEAAAGIRQPLTDYVASHPDLRIIHDRFMQIQQAVGTTKSHSPSHCGLPPHPDRRPQIFRLHRRLPNPLQPSRRHRRPTRMILEQNACASSRWDSELAADLWAIYSDPEVAHYIGGDSLTPESTRAQTERWATFWTTHGYGQSAVISRATGPLLGRIGLSYWPEWTETELGYALSRTPRAAA